MKRKIKYSPWFYRGIYQFEFTKTKIIIAKWDQIPTSTDQWAVAKGPGRFRFVGTSVMDIAMVKHED